MELSVYSVLVLLLSFIGGPDQEIIITKGFFHNWTVWSLGPMLTQAAGGLIVGFVAKYAGSEMKGFALIVGIILTATLQSFMLPDRPLQPVHYVSVALVITGMYLHSQFPPKPSIAASKKTQ
eukprot:TRINITY_DN24289_c0_g1_i1.p3 TRINITY_DN24289_c0_g1~~TRINITY_DN24289_c0_g1_i1.p3  ORF type:complete len:122 (+),score=26.69 TRINITY_DN24289_c0_g1_i1:642-1007(+)